MFTQDELNQLYRYALSISMCEDLAYDLLQESIERYLRKSLIVDTPIAYLKTMIRNLFIDWQRHNKVLPMLSIDSDDISCIEPIDNLMDELLINQQEVDKLIAMLNSEENELLYLWAVEEHTVDEIASIYEKPRGTILSRLHRLKKRLKIQLDKMNEGDDEHAGYSNQSSSMSGGTL